MDICLAAGAAEGYREVGVMDRQTQLLPLCAEGEAGAAG